MFSQVKNWLKRHQKTFLMLGAGIFLPAMGFLYGPPLMAIRQSHQEWMRLQAQVSEAHRIIDPLRREDFFSAPRSDALPAVLEQLNLLAQANNIQFLHMAPSPARAGEPSGLKVLPVELVLEGAYRSIGEFLGQLGTTPSMGGVVFQKLQIDREERLLPKLRARLSMELSLSGVADGR